MLKLRLRRFLHDGLRRRGKHGRARLRRVLEVVQRTLKRARGATLKTGGVRQSQDQNGEE